MRAGRRADPHRLLARVGGVERFVELDVDEVLEEPARLP
jgi:hypothetical protein